VNWPNCSSSDQIRRCPLGQICINEQCTNEISTSSTTGGEGGTTTSAATDANESSE